MMVHLKQIWMEPLDIKNFEHHCTEWSNNNNVGVEYEFALYYLLLDVKFRDIFKNITINNHAKKEKILQIIEAQKANIYQQISKSEYSTYKYVYLATQDDTVGPSDIVLYENADKTGSILGISVKYNNSCNVNMSSQYFLTATDKEYLKNIQKEYTNRHIDYQLDNRGNVENWFRIRKYSTTPYSTGIIDAIREHVIIRWNNGDVDKQNVIDKLYQIDSPINYEVWKFTKKKLKVLEKPNIAINPNDINIAKYRSSYIGFYHGDTLICKMQVKFNNGILERATPDTKDAICVNDVYMKMGDAFGSWNCTPVK
jgi:hypothetical protein